MSSKHFMNADTDIVTQALDGFLATSEPNRLARLDGYPHTKVIVRQTIDKSKVAVISGGGAGHEPAHAGFVGEGMLTAAVSGEIFASPTVDAVFQCIAAVTGEPGCLIILKNYTGDRLNFGLAAERAKSLGYKVSMVIVGDDIALPDSKMPRGVAGTLFTHKIASYLAEQGATLEEVAAAAQAVADDTITIGLSLTSCAIPGRAFEERIAADQAELGLGIHGEPGIELVPMTQAKSFIGTMRQKLLARLPDPTARYGLLINNLGGISNLEMSVLAGEAIDAFGDMISLIFGPAPLMTALNMNGFSLSLLKLTPERILALRADVAPPTWPRAVERSSQINVKPLPLPITQATSSYTPSTNTACQRILHTMCHTLIGLEEELNALDAKVGDGDTGSTFSAAARSILTQDDKLPYDNVGDLLQNLSDILAQSMGGSSGVLFSIFCAAAASEYRVSQDLAKAVAKGLERMQAYGGAKLGDRTMVDALVPASIALLEGKTLSDVASAANQGAEKTASLLQAGVGRSSYLNQESLEGVPDPGAIAVAKTLQSLSDKL